MKKFLNVKSVSAIILSFILAFTLCACQNAEPSSSSDDVTSMLSSPSSSIDDETSTDTTVDNSSQDEVSSETTDTPSKDTEPPATSSGTNTESSNTQSGTTDKTPTPSEPTTESTPTTTTPTPPAQKTAKELIVGKWRGSTDMAPMFAEEGYSVEGTMLVTCDIEFTSNGIIYETIDRTSLNTVYTSLYTKILNDTLIESGLTKEQFEASIGKTFDQYVEELVQTSINLVPQTFICAYKFEGNDLYVRDQEDVDFEKEEYIFNGENELILIEDGVSITHTRIG